MPKRYEADDRRQADYFEFARRIGQRVALARENADYTQHEICDLLKRSPGWIGMIETGRSMISLPDLIRVAKLLKLPVSYFFDGNLDPELVEARKPGDWYDVFPHRRDWATGFAMLHQAYEDFGDTYFERYSDPATAAIHIMVQAGIDRNTVRAAKNTKRDYAGSQN